MDKLRFTVAISAYNIQNYIGRAIKSVLNQKFDNYEIIIVDDCSTDNTVQEIEKYKNNKISLHHTKCNTGTAGGTRNVAIDNAKGEYIIFLDGDDVLYNDETLKKIDNIIKDQTPDIVFLGFQDVGNGDKIRKSNEVNSTKKARLICDVSFSVSSRCWRTEFLKQNNMKFVEGVYYEDEIFCIKGTIIAKKTMYGEIQIFKYYRNRKGSVTSTPSIKKCSDWYRMLAEVTDLYAITPEEYKPYLLSFIKNENASIPKRIAAILRAMIDGENIKALPKRNYEYIDFWADDD